MKKILILVILLFAVPSFAGVTITIADTGSGSVMKAFDISTAKVNRLQTMAEDTGKASMTYLTEAVGDVFLLAEAHEQAKVGRIPSELKTYILENKENLCVLAGCP